MGMAKTVWERIPVPLHSIISLCIFSGSAMPTTEPARGLDRRSSDPGHRWVDHDRRWDGLDLRYAECGTIGVHVGSPALRSAGLQEAGSMTTTIRGSIRYPVLSRKGTYENFRRLSVSGMARLLTIAYFL